MSIPTYTLLCPNCNDFHNHGVTWGKIKCPKCGSDYIIKPVKTGETIQDAWLWDENSAHSPRAWTTIGVIPIIGQSSGRKLWLDLRTLADPKTSFCIKGLQIRENMVGGYSWEAHPASKKFSKSKIKVRVCSACSKNRYYLALLAGRYGKSSFVCPCGESESFEESRARGEIKDTLFLKGSWAASDYTFVLLEDVNGAQYPVNYMTVRQALKQNGQLMHLGEFEIYTPNNQGLVTHPDNLLAQLRR